jgi:hypothetical protein
MRRSGPTETVALVLFLCTGLFAQAPVHRGRNEGTTNIPASNVIGNGNVTVTAAAIGSYGTIGTFMDPTFGISTGISDVMEIRGKTAFTNFRGLGTSEAHLQLTLPGNDHLRFFGIALCGDLFLSSATDTISASAAAGKPEYNSYMRPSGIIDFDWLALVKTFPLKTYFEFGMADDPTLLYRYDQLSIKAGVEWKMKRQSGYCDIGAGLYREKAHGTYGGERSYDQRVLWFEPGFRYHLSKGYSLLGSVRLLAYRQLKQHRPLPTTSIRGAAAIELPLLFRETNTEALRTLVFVEWEKEKAKDSISLRIEQGKGIESGLAKEFKALDINADIPDAEQAKEELRKRQEIQEKMDEIETLLQENQ